MLKGLKVHVGGLVTNGLPEHEVDETDDGRPPGHLFNVALAAVVFLVAWAGLGDLGEQFHDRRLVFAVVLFDKTLDAHGIAHDEAHVFAKGKGEVIHHLAVERLGREQATLVPSTRSGTTP